MTTTNSEYYVVRLIIIIAALIIGFLGARLIGKLYYNKLMNENTSLGDFQKHYQDQINLETNPYKLGKMGMIFLRTENNDLAYECFKKTTTLDPLWRDGWFWQGNTELKINRPKEALLSLKKAEELDPIYPLTYQLLVIAYEEIGDTISAEKAQEKLGYLSKTYKTK